MKIEKTQVFGFLPAIRAMRNPLNSWDKSDTFSEENIGPNDLKLMQSLIKAGPEHSKFMRQIIIWVDMTLPIYIWSEFDTYKVGVVRNSCSTMHKLTARELTPNDFEDQAISEDTLRMLNVYGDLYRREKNFNYLYKMKQILPASYLQKATIIMNYQVALNMFNQRKNHKLPEWKLDSNKYSICMWILDLPKMKELLENVIEE